MFKFLTKLLKSPNVLTGVFFGISGLAFAVANVILATVETVEDYALFSLAIAVLTMFSGLGLFGADGIVNRRDIAPDFRMFGRVISTSSIAAIMAATVLFRYYDVAPPIVVLVSIAVMAQTIIYFTAAYFQSRQDFRLSLITFNSSNFILLIVALISKINAWEEVFAPLLLTTALLVIAASLSTVKVRSKYDTEMTGDRYSWREALAYISLTGSASVLIQLERLMTPQLLDLANLTTLGVLLAIVGPPFRLLQVTLGYVLLPRLRAATSIAETKSLVIQEIGLALALVVPSWFLAWYLVPFIDQYFFGEKYQLSAELILSVIFEGTAKALSGIARASVTALVSARRLELMGIAGWLGVALSIIGAYFGASFGLAGVVYGVSLGWVLRLLVAAVLVRKSLKVAPRT